MAGVREWWTRGRQPETAPRSEGLTIDGNAVHRYVDEATLLDQLEFYVTEAWLAGQRTVAFAGHETIKELRMRLAAWHMEGALEAHDVTWALGQVIRDGMPSQELFDALLENTLGRHEPGDVRLYNEMVPALWQRGAVSGALVLQEMWHTYLLHNPVPRLSVYNNDAPPDLPRPRVEESSPTDRAC